MENIELRPIGVDKPSITKDHQDHQPDCSNQNQTSSGRVKSFFQERFKITSISLTILLLWLLFESLLCVIVLNDSTENYVENFLWKLCNKKDWPTLLSDLLYFRILVSSVSIIGILLGHSSVASTWVIMNALGLCPLLPVVVSCYHKYEDLDSVIDNASAAWKIIKYLYNAIMPATSI